MKSDYRVEKTTRFLDGIGSIETFEKKVHAGATVNPTKHYFEMKHRVRRDDISTLTKLYEELVNDPLKLECAIKIEGKRVGSKSDYIHLIQCYTHLE